MKVDEVDLATQRTNCSPCILWFLGVQRYISVVPWSTRIVTACSLNFIPLFFNYTTTVDSGYCEVAVWEFALWVIYSYAFVAAVFVGACMCDFIDRSWFLLARSEVLVACSQSYELLVLSLDWCSSSVSTNTYVFLSDTRRLFSVFPCLFFFHLRLHLYQSVQTQSQINCTMCASFHITYSLSN